MWTGVLLGTLGCLSTENWQTIWFILEINLICFMTFISHRWTAKKIGIIYFIVQSLGTLMLLRGGILRDLSSQLSHWIVLGLLLKSRLAPFHFWGPALISKLTNLTNCVFITWQKIAPVFIIIITTPKCIHLLIIFINILSSSIISIGSKSIFILLFFSGLMHMRWIMAAPYRRAIIYYLFYVVTTLPIFLTGPSFNLNLLMLNAAGLPPITGFFIKLIVLQNISIGLRRIILLLSIPLLYAYVRVFIYGTRKIGTINVITLMFCSLGLII